MSRGLPKRLVAAVLERDRGLCVLQISPDCLGAASVADHRANRGHGGAKTGVLDRMSNLVAACGICNGAKEDATGALRDSLVNRGLRISPGRTHAHTAEKVLVLPVYYPDGEPWWLDDEGGRRGQPW